jgi:hypothetical protein
MKNPPVTPDFFPPWPAWLEHLCPAKKAHNFCKMRIIKMLAFNTGFMFSNGTTFMESLKSIISDYCKDAW